MIIKENGINWVHFYDLDRMKTWREHKGEITTKNAISVNIMFVDVKHGSTWELDILAVHGVVFW